MEPLVMHWLLWHHDHVSLLVLPSALIDASSIGVGATFLLSDIPSFKDLHHALRLVLFYSFCLLSQPSKESSQNNPIRYYNCIYEESATTCPRSQSQLQVTEFEPRSASTFETTELLRTSILRIQIILSQNTLKNSFLNIKYSINKHTNSQWFFTLFCLPPCSWTSFTFLLLPFLNTHLFLPPSALCFPLPDISSLSLHVL